MALGLIKKEIIHTSKSSPARLTGPGQLLGPTIEQDQKLQDAETEFTTQMGKYEAQQFTNPYAKMENTMEDLTINQKQAQFEAQQTQQSQANILNAMAGSGSFNAGNVQALANQAQLGAQKASASIGQQEASNRKLAAQEASRLQQLSAKGDFAVQQMRADKQATQLGMSMQQVANAQEAIAARQQMIGNIIGGVTSAAGSIFAGKI